MADVAHMGMYDEPTHTIRQAADVGIRGRAAEREGKRGTTAFLLSTIT